MTIMLVPHHHPSRRLLCRYASGQLHEASMLFVEVHLDLCPLCRKILQNEETRAALDLEAIEPEAIDDSCLNNLLHLIDEHGPPSCIDVTLPPPVNPASFLPFPLQSYLGTRLDLLLWHFYAKGSFYFYEQRENLLPLPENMVLLRFNKNARITLKGKASLLIIKGSIRGLLRSYNQGDIITSGLLSSFGLKAAEESFCLAMTKAE